LPPGNYEFSATVPGFNRYNRPGLVVQVAVMMRIDIALEAGLPQESVTVTEAAPLLTVRRASALINNAARNEMLVERSTF
jgi:hypothetical protein